MSEKNGIFRSLRGFWATLAEAAQDRLSLLANEAEEARILFIGALLRALLALFCLMMALVLVTLFLLLAFPHYQLLIAALLILLFFCAALALWLASRASFTRGKLFTASIAELQEDIRALRGGMKAASSDAPRLPHLFEERGFIRARIAARREKLAGYGKPIERLCSIGDAARGGIVWIREHQLALGLISGAALLIFRPMRFSRLFTWGRRLFILLRIRKKWLLRLSFLRFFIS